MDSVGDDSGGFTPTSTGASGSSSGTTTGVTTASTSGTTTATTSADTTGGGPSCGSPGPECVQDFAGWRCNVNDESTYQPTGFTCCPDDYLNTGITRCYCDADFVACLPPLEQIPDGCFATAGDDILCNGDPNDTNWDCCTLDEPVSIHDVVCWPTGTTGPNDHTCEAAADTGTTSASGTESGESTGSTDPCPNHRRYQCSGRKYGVYERVDEDGDDDFAWSPPFISEDPVECYPPNGYNVAGGSNPQLYGDAIEVCAPEALGDLTDPDDPMVDDIRALCLAECQARPLPTQIVATYDQGGVFDWNLVNTVCEIGPGLTQINEEGLPGGFLPCESSNNYDQIADVGECDGGVGKPDECPAGDQVLCREWEPNLWVYSSTDRAGNVISVIDEDFFDELSLGLGFACDAPAFVFDANGAGISEIDGVQPNDFYERLGLVDGDSEFELRAKSGGTWSSWYALDTYAEAVTAFSALDALVSTEFELRYESEVTGSTTTRAITVVDCTAGGDNWRCDFRDTL